MKNLTHNLISKNNGTVLVVSLLMLFVLTLIGVSSINTTTLEEKMSGNTRNRHLAFQAAETGVRDAERYITDNVNFPTAQFVDPSTTDGLYFLGKGPSSADAVDSSWWTTAGNTSREYTGDLQDVASASKYTIEYLGLTSQEEATDINITNDPTLITGIHTYRITSRGTGLTDNAVVVIQSHFGKR